MATSDAVSRILSYGDDASKKKKLFYTTSDMMETMNKVLSNMDSPDDGISPRVELQRRMPDGSTRRADNKDLEAADMDSKLKQAAEQVAHLTPKGKIEWAEHQRIEGNNLYKLGDYRAALDVYLTCLVSKTDDEEFSPRVFLPVMNNLAQTALQLGMYRKVEQFCTMALDEITDDESGQLVAKLYFRRGRARRLSGDYAEARQDLETAIFMLEDDSTEKRSVQRELQLVQRAEVEGRRNQKRQECAMKQMLGGRVGQALDEDQAGDIDHENIPRSLASSSGLYQDIGTRRTYSALTAKRKNAMQTDEKLTYWRWYLSVVARVAEKLLVLLGDEEYVDRYKDDEDADSRPKHD